MGETPYKQSPFKLVTEVRFPDGRTERGEVPFETKMSGAHIKGSKEGDKIIPESVKKNLEGLEESDPRRAEDLKDYLKQVTDEATGLLNSKDGARHDRYAYADVLAVLGDRLALATGFEVYPDIGSGNPKIDEQRRLERISVTQTFEKIGNKLFPDVVKPKNNIESKKAWDQVVIRLDKPRTLTGADVVQMKNLNWALAPAETIMELQKTLSQLSETMFGASNADGTDEDRGFGVKTDRQLEVTEIARAIFTIQGVIEQIKQDTYGRSDITTNEIVAMDTAKASAENLAGASPNETKGDELSPQKALGKEIAFITQRLPHPYKHRPNLKSMDGPKAEQMAGELKQMWKDLRDARKTSAFSIDADREYIKKLQALFERYR